MTLEIAPAEEVRTSARDGLRALPPLAWLYLALTLLALVVALAGNSIWNLSLLLGASAFGAPGIFAATLAYVAPHQRFAQASAACFAIPMAIATLSQAVSIGVLSSTSLSSDWANLIPTLQNALNAVMPVIWLIDLAAVLFLSLHIGRIQTRTGWWILAAGLVVTAMRIILAAGFVADQFSQFDLTASPETLQLLVSPLAGLVGAGWALLLAIAWARRLALLALAAVIQLALSLLAVATQTVLADWFQASSQAGSVDFLAVLFVLSAMELVYLVAMEFGILREVPRHGQSTDTDAVTAQ
ncbi:MAG TPA: hypothetical protein VH371_05375 [Candidatus Limnocylindrales bacterium]